MQMAKESSGVGGESFFLMACLEHSFMMVSESSLILRGQVGGQAQSFRKIPWCQDSPATVSIHGAVPNVNFQDLHRTRLNF